MKKVFCKVSTWVDCCKISNVAANGLTLKRLNVYQINRFQALLVIIDHGSHIYERGSYLL